MSRRLMRGLARLLLAVVVAGAITPARAAGAPDVTCPADAPGGFCDEQTLAAVSRADRDAIGEAVTVNASGVLGLPTVPNPLSLVPDIPSPGDVAGAVGDAVSGTAGKAVDEVVGGVAGGIFDSIADGVAEGATWLLGKIAGLIDTTTKPDTQAKWFTAEMASIAQIAALVAVPLLIIGALSAIKSRDLGSLLTSAFVVLPLAMVLTAASAALAALLIGATDELTRVVAADAGKSTGIWFKELARPLGPDVGGVSTAAIAEAGGIPSMLRALVGMLMVLGSVVVWIELTLRSAAIYLTVACLPLAYVAMLYPRWVTAGRRAVEVVLALIFSKFFIVLALSIGAKALGEGDGINALMAGLSILVLTAFVPVAIFMLLPQIGQAMQQNASMRSSMRGIPGMGMAQQAGSGLMLDRLRSSGGGGGGGGGAEMGAGKAASAALGPPGAVAGAGAAAVGKAAGSAGKASTAAAGSSRVAAAGGAAAGGAAGATAAGGAARKARPAPSSGGAAAPAGGERFGGRRGEPPASPPDASQSDASAPPPSPTPTPPLAGGASVAAAAPAPGGGSASPASVAPPLSTSASGPGPGQGSPGPQASVGPEALTPAAGASPLPAGPQPPPPPSAQSVADPALGPRAANQAFAQRDEPRESS